VSEAAAGVSPATAEVRLYDKLFNSADPMAFQGDWKQDLNPQSLVVSTAFVSTPLLESVAAAGKTFQFDRVGYFCVDPDSVIDNDDKTKSKLVFNRVCGLKAANNTSATKRANKVNA